MNRNITLILSAIAVVVLLAVWLYLMFFAPKNSDQGSIEGSGTFTEFDDLGSNAPNDSNGSLTNGGNNNQGGQNNEGTGDEPYDPDILRQLTTRNIAGHKEVVLASTTKVLYMESGVGHIYSLDLETGEEERVSATTIPDARVADFSNDGSLVAVKTGNSTGINPLLLAVINYDSKTVSMEPVAEQVAQFNFGDDDTLMYSVISNSSVIGRSFETTSATNKTLFETPFREATVAFGANSDGPHYFYPKTSHLLEGFIYEVDDGSVSRLAVDGFGFAASVLDGMVVSSYREQTNLVTSIYNQSSAVVTQSDKAVIPEKCISSASTLYCAIPSNTNLQYNSIDEWYKGTKSFADNLWVIGDVSETLIDITNFSGRNVDVINGLVGDESGDWYFQNKADNTLWIYELSQVTENNAENL